MAPQKRKRPHDDLPDLPESTVQSPKSQSKEPIRRVTRQNPQGLLDEEKHHLRSGRVRANTTEKTSAIKPVPERARGKRNDAPRTATDLPAVMSAVVPVKQTRNPRHTPAPTEPSKENIRPDTDTPSLTETTPITPPKPALPSRNVSSRPTIPPKTSPPQSRTRSRALPAKAPVQQKQHPLNQILPPPSSSSSAAAAAAAAAAVVTAPAQAPALATPKRSLAEKPMKAPTTPRSDRNIDKVVLGNICFRAWYPSYYGKEVLGDLSGNAGGGKDIGARMGGGKRDPPILDRLYVCPCCFKYSKEIVPWWEHVRCCEQKGIVPGRKVYTHPKGARARKVKSAAIDPPPAVKGKGKKKIDTEAPAVEESTDEDGEWSVWEVDGENERLFCQNLSLFAKLFLDNKSVFFDVSGFNYFLLVYTPHSSSSSSSSIRSTSPTEPQPDAAPAQTFSTTTVTTTITTTIYPTQQQQQQQQDLHRSPPSPSPSPSPPRRPHIVGFFSKEKMSWDNNNLACILVFPPWQRKGLGSLLMGVSYEISRREGILGGPEKPISELGRKGYKRFWAGEIARWLLLGLEEEEDHSSSPSSSSTSSAASASSPASPTEAEVGVRSGAGAGAGAEDGEEGDKEGEGEERRAGKRQKREPLVVDIQMCSRATWIVPEDCLLVLREMGVVEEEAGPGSPDPDPAPGAATVTTAVAAAASGDAAVGEAAEDDVAPTAGREAKHVPRVRIDKAAVRRWVEANKIDLERTCDPGGFLEGYAVKTTEIDADDGE